MLCVICGIDRTFDFLLCVCVCVVLCMCVCGVCVIGRTSSSRQAFGCGGAAGDRAVEAAADSRVGLLS